MKKSVILIGCMGAGKSYIGRDLADKLKIGYIDMDEYMESIVKMSVSDIFKNFGEVYFRNLETNVLLEVLADFQIRVISSGGGLILKEDNRKAMKTGAQGLKCVYLYADINTLWERVKHDEKRPLLKKDDPKAELEKIFLLRDPLYRQCADFIIETDNKERQAIVSEIICCIS